MLSFFSKKKPIVETSTLDPPIQGPAETNTGDDFIFVERKPTDGPAYPPPNPSMYPPMPAAYGSGGSGGYGQPLMKNDSECCNVPYVQGVPFIFSPLIASDDQFTGTSSEVDRILALLTRQMSVDEELNDYNFTLEKSVLNS